MAVLQSAAMAQASGSANTAADGNPIFHDFFGASCSSFSPAGVVSIPLGDDVRQAEASLGASAGTSSNGGRRILADNSDLPSGRQVIPFEGVPCYGRKDDIIGNDIRISGNKRSIADSIFNGSLREHQAGISSLEGLHSMKSFRNAGEWHLKSSVEDFCVGIQQRAPSSVSLILQASSRHDSGVSKWDRSNMPTLGSPPQCSQPITQFGSFVSQEPSRTTGENSAGLFVSQTVADEGSRTGVKRYGILSSISSSSGLSASERSQPLISGSASRSNHGANSSQPESSTPTSHGLASVSRQMTIFYGGHAHVFDDVHPNKADVIMALAGSNGGSWSTTYSPKPQLKSIPTAACVPHGVNEKAVMGNRALLQEFCLKPSSTCDHLKKFNDTNAIINDSGNWK